MTASAPPRREQIKYYAAGGIAILLAAVLVVVFAPRGEPPAPGPCGALIQTDKGECVGIIDRVELLPAELHGVAKKIFAENRQVEASATYVKVALLTPLSVAGGGHPSAMSMDQVRFSLEGTYTALHRANNSKDFGDENVKIKVVLVNYGSRQEHSDRLVEWIIATSEPQHPLVAVVGLGSSFRGTEATAKALAAKGIPMVSAVASSNSLDRRSYPTLYSVSPSNDDYARALLDLLDKHRSEIGLADAEGVIVADKNDDPYVRTLRESFVRVLRPYVKHAGQDFTGGTVDAPARPREFENVVISLCQQVLESKPGTSPEAKPRLKMVFYAGRVGDFEAFAETLKTRTCRNAPLAILVGATGFHAAQRYEDLLRDANITVIYASSADAPLWMRGHSHTPEGFAAFHESFQALNGPLNATASLVDGYLIMYHDALAACVRAIRYAAGSGIPGPADVNLAFGNLHDAYRVRAASGTLTYDQDRRPDGRPLGKPVVYRQVGPTDVYRLPDVEPYVMK